MNTEEMLIEKRKEKVISFFKKSGVWVVGLLIVALILGVYIRSLPMQDHGGKPGLWDITTNDWTLGPDLDPWLFTRYAKTIVENGSLPAIDNFRNVPLGFENSLELPMVAHMIVLTYKILSIFSTPSVIYAAVLMPVIFFGLTIIVFFLFVREIFVLDDDRKKKRADIIALISTFLMVVAPAFLSRTIAGIPEKESVGFFFMFLSFYLFLKAWKSKKIIWIIILSGIAGISTGLMGLAWGGVVYAYVTIALAGISAFIINKVRGKEFIAYSLWLFTSWLLVLVVSNRVSLREMITSLDTGLAFLIFFIMAVHFLVWNTPIGKIKFLQRSKLPRNIISVIIAVIVGVFLISILLGPGFILGKLSDFNQMMFHPVSGRWNTSVAENRQPFFTEWANSFGPLIRGIPVMFWMFFAGSVVLFRKMLDCIKKKDAWILTSLYVLFFFGLVFSRYSSTSLFNGENFISKSFYYLSALIFIGFVIYYYIKDHQSNEKYFEKIDYKYLLLFSLFILTVFTARSAVRLIMVLAPVAPIFVSYLIVTSIERFRVSRGESSKAVIGVIVVLVVILTGFIFWNQYNAVKQEAYGFVPSYYNHQWQNAMQWVRNETPKNAVFAHWWDYGYWVQSIGDRATVLDGGNALVYWNYLMGRLVLTGDNQHDSLEFLYNHNTTHLLIDSSDIGKYGAFSSIGSDANMDRYSWIPTMASDPAQTQETSSGIMRVYPSGFAIDEDINYEINGTKIFLPSGKAGIGAIILKFTYDNVSTSVGQPIGVFIYNGQRIDIPLRYAEVNGEFKDFGKGLEGTVKVIQSVQQGANGALQVDQLGAVIYISPRVMRGFLGQKYLLNDPLNNFPNFKLAHSENNIIVDSLNSQGAKLREFAYYPGLSDSLFGPIKIWDIKYEGTERINPLYTQTTLPSSITWQL